MTFSSSGTDIPISDDDLFYKGYKQFLHNKDGHWVDVTTGRFMSWWIPSIPATGTRFLYGKILQQLTAGTSYTITMTLYFKGSKVDYTPQITFLSDLDVLANLQLGIALLVSGFVSIIIVVTIMICKKKYYRY